MTNMRCSLSLIGGLICLLPQLTAAEMWMVREGKPRAEIVIANKPVAMVNVAASELCA